MITAAIGGWIAKPVVSIGVGLFHWNYHIFKDQVYSLALESPGGGGPGQSLTSTNPPPSIEEVGRIITGLSEMGHGEPGVGRGKKNGKRPRCPSGYRWDKKRRKCVRIRKY